MLAERHALSAMRGWLPKTKVPGLRIRNISLAGNGQGHPG
jgi:hypothetical protein